MSGSRGFTRILLAGLAFLLVAVSPVGGAEVGESMPDFVMQTFDGSTSSSEALAGRPLMLIFWNTWCPDCMRELPAVNRLAKKFIPRGLAFLAINTAINDSKRRARAYWMKKEFLFPSGFDHDFEIGDLFKVRGVPTIFLIDSKGIIRHKHPKFPENMEKSFKLLTSKDQ